MSGWECIVLRISFIIYIEMQADHFIGINAPPIPPEMQVVELSPENEPEASRPENAVKFQFT